MLDGSSRIWYVETLRRYLRLALIIHAGCWLPRSVPRIAATAEILASGYDCCPAGGAGSPYLTGAPPIQPLLPAHPEPAGRPYGALAATRPLATFRDRLRQDSCLACRALRVVAMRTRRIWFCGFANPRAFLATSLAVRLCASAFALE